MMLRLCTWNTWHGLNPYLRLLMPPMETPWARYRRRGRQIEAIRELQASDIDVFCLQEVNPLHSRRKLLQKRLGMKSFGCRSNVGVKIAGLGFPPLLSEGLVTLAGSAHTRKKSLALTLSGHAAEYRSRLGFSVSLQLEERRRALILESEVRGRKIAVVNLHLHHGPDAIEENRSRKRSELERLARWLKPRLDQFDWIAVCGDFNCDPDSSAMEPLTELDFVDLAGLSEETVLPSWDPRSNLLAQASVNAADKPAARGWDSQIHSFDRIYVHSQEKPQGVRMHRVFDSTLSDHFGILAEVSFL